MKRLIIIAAALALAACASPRNATIEDGKVTNITSAEATTLMLGEQRRSKVQDVQTNQKPIVRITANAGKPITMAINAMFTFRTDIGLVMAMTVLSLSSADHYSLSRPCAQHICSGLARLLRRASDLFFLSGCKYELMRLWFCSQVLILILILIYFGHIQ